MDLPQRKMNRLKGYDYSQSGAYFVTVCTQDRQQIFETEDVGNGLCAVPCVQNQIVHKWIGETENKFRNIQFEKYVIMPDHLHFIIRITERHAGRSLQDVMRFFKTMTTNEYIRNVREGAVLPFKQKLWQKSYYDHIIRSEQDYDEIWEYIENNPKRWMLQRTNQTENL